MSNRDLPREANQSPGTVSGSEAAGAVVRSKAVDAWRHPQGFLALLLPSTCGSSQEKGLHLAPVKIYVCWLPGSQWAVWKILSSSFVLQLFTVKLFSLCRIKGTKCSVIFHRLFKGVLTLAMFAREHLFCLQKHLLISLEYCVTLSSVKW